MQTNDELDIFNDKTIDIINDELVEICNRDVNNVSELATMIDEVNILLNNHNLKLMEEDIEEFKLGLEEDTFEIEEQTIDHSVFQVYTLNNEELSNYNLEVTYAKNPEEDKIAVDMNLVYYWEFEDDEDYGDNEDYEDDEYNLYS